MILVLRRLKQEGGKFKARLSHILSNEFHADLSYPKTVGFEHRDSAQSKGRIHRVRLDTLE